MGVLTESVKFASVVYSESGVNKGFEAQCESEDHGQKGWRGPLYLVGKSAPSHYLAEADAFQHNLTEHRVVWEFEPTWEEILSGAHNERRRVSHAKPSRTPHPLRVPFEPRSRIFWREFGEALQAYWYGVRELFGRGQR